MLSAAGLLQPEAEAVWRKISLAEASEHVSAVREAAKAREGAARLVESARPSRAKRRIA